MRILSIVGARPQFVKLGPICSEFASRNSKGAAFEHIIVHTGQHYDEEMSNLLFDQLGLPEPQQNLGVGSGSHAEQTAKMMIGLEASIRDHEPDFVLVYGDTNSTLAGAIAARKLNVATGHVEAGLRSGRRDMPEEINRIVSDSVCDILMAPTQAAMDNLDGEGLAHRSLLTGDVMLDAVIQYSKLAHDAEHGGAESEVPEEYAIATVHRAENTEPERLASLVDALSAIAQGGLHVILPLHPRTRAMLPQEALHHLQRSGVQVCAPLGYLETLRMVQDARVVLTDSGGLQKEAFILGAPCVVLRDETEWVEAVEAGGNILAGADQSRIVDAVEKLSAKTGDTDKAAWSVYGEGQAARRIVDAVCDSCEGTSSSVMDTNVRETRYA